MMNRFDNSQDFIRDYFGTFLLKLFVCKVDILKSEAKCETIKGISGFISKFAEEYMKLYLEVSQEKKFIGVIQVQ
jgi:hypothetical protein